MLRGRRYLGWGLSSYRRCRSKIIDSGIRLLTLQCSSNLAFYQWSSGGSPTPRNPNESPRPNRHQRKDCPFMTNRTQYTVNKTRCSRKRQTSPRCRHQANCIIWKTWRHQQKRKYITYILSHCRQRRSDSRPQVTYKKFGAISRRGFWHSKRTDRQTYRHPDYNTSHLSGGRSKTYSSCAHCLSLSPCLFDGSL